MITTEYKPPTPMDVLQAIQDGNELRMAMEDGSYTVRRKGRNGGYIVPKETMRQLWEAGYVRISKGGYPLSILAITVKGKQALDSHEAAVAGSGEG